MVEAQAISKLFQLKGMGHGLSFINAESVPVLYTPLFVETNNK